MVLTEEEIEQLQNGKNICDTIREIPLIGDSLGPICDQTSKTLLIITIIVVIWAIFVTLALIYLILKAAKKRY